MATKVDLQSAFYMPRAVCEGMGETGVLSIRLCCCTVGWMLSSIDLSSEP